MAGRSWICGFRPRLPLKSCGSCVVQRGSNNAKALAHACFAQAKRKETMWSPRGSTWFRQRQRRSYPRFPLKSCGSCVVQRGSNNVDARYLQPASRPFSAGCAPLLDASSALTKGGQVMFCPQPLHQLPKLPSHVVPECAACLEKQSGQTAPS